MGDLLRSGLAWLDQMRAAHLASPVEYHRGAEVAHLSATFGRTEYEISDAAGATVSAQVWDFLITAAELGFEPEAGDVIVADGRRHEVMRLGSEGCWRFSDPFGTTYRIHTKHIGDA